MIHLIHQIEVPGPSYLHEMWAYEWFMSVLSRYVHNRAYPEGSMIEGYTTEEVVECCQEYREVQRGIDNPDSRHKGRLARKGTSGRKTFIDYEYKEVSQAYYCVLQNTKLMQPKDILTWERKGGKGKVLSAGPS
jgi:hypothetical protein